MLSQTADLLVDDCPAASRAPSAGARGLAGRPDWLPPVGARLAALTHTRRRFPSIGLFLDAASVEPLELSPWRRPDALLAWSGGAPARLARHWARACGLPFLFLEDGFLRSVGLGKAGAAPVSMVADDLGLHFDARTSSRLERLLSEAHADARRGQALRALIASERLTKYNHLPDRPLRLKRTLRRRILLVDQVAGDRSVAGAGADAATFRTMLDAARTERAEIVVKVHPDVAAGVARGHLAPLLRGETVIAEPVSPHAVLDVVDEVWTVSSQLGLDALLRGLPVRTFGMPCYAGWGLTDDHADGPVAEAALARRRRRLSIDEFVDIALRRYALYGDPVTRRRVAPEQAIDRLLAWRRRALEMTGTYLCLSFSRHKHAVARRFLEGPWSRVAFADLPPSAARLRRADHVVMWGDKAADAPALRGRRVIRVEDGFVRSAGLGSDKVAPASLCFDPDGLYCDATRPSRLETLLNTHAFEAGLLQRAGRLRQALVAARITKYNLPGLGPAPAYRRLAHGRDIVVVAAQVPKDASLRLGLPLHAGNLGLLAAVRLARPDAMIVYKDHPELVAGNRPGRVAERALAQYADLVVGDVALDSLLEAAAEVHVATSQLGFEALLRGCRVTCHGVPFYAGWGVTEDLVPPPRPRRRLSLDALIAGALILYPAYVSPRTGLPCEVEDVLAELAGGAPGRAPR